MIKNINVLLDKICGLPRPKRCQVREILKEVYEQGKSEGKRIIKDKKII